MVRNPETTYKSCETVNCSQDLDDKWADLQKDSAQIKKQDKFSGLYLYNKSE